MTVSNRRRLVVHTVPALGEPQEGRDVEVGILVADDPREGDRGVLPIALFRQRLGTLEQADGDLRIERPRAHHRAGRPDAR